MMNNDELITLMRDQRTRVSMTTPLDEIIDRGRALRARRRIPGVAGATIMATAVVAVTAMTAFGHGSHVTSAPAKTELAAWTVTKQANGDVTLAIRQLRDWAGLAAALRADGVPANVAVRAPRSVTCTRYPASESQVQAIYQFHDNALVIKPSAIPRGARLFIADLPASKQRIRSRRPNAGRTIDVIVVRAGARCPLFNAQYQPANSRPR